jgi:cell division protein FtsZ
MSFVQFGEPKASTANIKVIGVGGAGGNAVNAMVNAGIDGVDFIVVNTDVQALEASLAHRKIQIGKNLTRGLGAGANPSVGQQAVEENIDDVLAAITESDMVFITAGMGGGTGTGAAPVIAEAARNMGALTVAVVTKPFTFEGKPRREKADEGLERLRSAVDTLIVIPNDRIFAISEPNTPITDAFLLADNILLQATRGISDLITETGYINLDFADVKSIMLNMGDALMGSGTAHGSNRATIAAQEAISSPLLEGVTIKGALGALINITAGPSLTLQEVNEAATLIQEHAGDEANVIFGMVIDPNFGDELRVTVIATGFNSDARQLKTLQQTQKDERSFKPSQVEKHVPKPVKQAIAKNEHPEQLHIIPVDEDDVPAFLRKKPEAKPASERQPLSPFDQKENPTDKFTKPSSAPTNYDIPTFLRNSMD